MARWYGKIGFIETVETTPGVWKPKETINEYYGDIPRNNSRWSTNSESTNDNLTVNAQISIVADPFANTKFYSMKWVEFMGAKWKVTNVEPQPPRLILTLGEPWNG